MCWFRGPWQLPKPEGPYVPGVVDIFSADHPAQLVRLYYPTDLPVDKDHSSQYVNWLSHERLMEGLAAVVKIWLWVVRIFYWLVTGTAMVPAVWAAAPARRRLPVIVVSHGLGGSRVLYTTTVVQLASQGFLVAALDHGDMSACITYRRRPREQWIRFQHLPQQSSQFAALREGQIEYRVKECLATLRLLDSYNSGAVTSHIDLTGLLDFSRLAIMGHSFGAATALLTLGREPRFKLGVILDAWMYPINKFKDTLPDDITQPLIFINTETFHIEKNIKGLRRYVKEHPLYTMRGTTHEHQTDTTHLFGSWLNITLRRKLSAETATRINNHLILRWLKQHIDMPLTVDHDFLNSQAENIVNDFIHFTK